MRPYLEAKADADAALVASGLDWTRSCAPAALTDDPGTGRSTSRPRWPPRADPARGRRRDARACLDAPETIGLTFEAFAGDQDVELAVRALREAA